MYKYIFILIIDLGIVSTILSQQPPHPFLGEGVIYGSTLEPNRNWGMLDGPAPYDAKEPSEVKRLVISEEFFLQERSPLDLPNVEILEIMKLGKAYRIDDIIELKEVHKSTQLSNKVYHWENFVSWDKIHTLQVYALEDIQPRALSQIIEKCTNLERLIIDNFVFEDDSLITFSQKAHLKSLELNDMYSIHSFRSTNIPKWIFRFTEIDTLRLDFWFPDKIPNGVYDLHHVKHLFLSSDEIVDERITKLASLEGLDAHLPDTLYHLPKLKILYRLPYDKKDLDPVTLKYLYKLPIIEKITLKNLKYERDKYIFLYLKQIKDLTIDIDSLGEEFKYLTKLQYLDCNLHCERGFVNVLPIGTCKELKRIGINLNYMDNNPALHRNPLIKFPDNINNCTNLQEIKLDLRNWNSIGKIYFPPSFKSVANQMKVFKIYAKSNIDLFYPYMLNLNTLLIAGSYHFRTQFEMINYKKGGEVPDNLSQMTQLDSLFIYYPIKKWNKKKWKNPSLHYLEILYYPMDEFDWIVKNRRDLFPRLEVIYGICNVDIIDFKDYKEE